MTIHQMQEEILRLKQKQNVCILAHSYQAREILEIADFTGDSFQLSLKAASAPQSRMLLCGVRFMAESYEKEQAEPLSCRSACSFIMIFLHMTGTKPLPKAGAPGISPFQRDHVSCSSSLRFARLTRLICRSKSPLLISSVRTSWSNVGTVQE